MLIHIDNKANVYNSVTLRQSKNRSIVAYNVTGTVSIVTIRSKYNRNETGSCNSKEFPLLYSNYNALYLL